MENRLQDDFPELTDLTDIYMPTTKPSKRLVSPIRAPGNMLSAAEFQQLAQVPPAAERFANIDNPNTRRAYRNDLTEFMTFIGIAAPAELRLVTRSHILA